MGARGPSPTPTSILKIRGSWRSKTRKGEPEPENGRPSVPPGLTDPAKKIWNALLDKLEKMPGILATCDGGQLERYCVYFVDWREVVAEINRLTAAVGGRAALLKDERTRPIIRGLWAESHKLDVALKQVEREFHLTPSARARVGLMNALGEAVTAPDPQGKDRFFA